jgi:hypothetical protein
MNDPSSGTVRALLDVAKVDGPSAGARAKIWSGVSSSAAAGIGAAGAAKMLIGGTLLGATVSAGIAATMLYVAGTSRPAKAAANVTPYSATADAPTLSPPVLAPTLSPTLASTPTPRTATTLAPGPKATSVPPPVRIVPHAEVADDALAREASLVDAARSALARGNAREALRAIRATRALPERQLLPEELTVEGQALRMVGRGDQASAVEADLKAKYPESALAR